MLVYAGTGNPASEKQHPITNSLLKIDADPESKKFGKILASHRGTSDSYPFPQDVDSPTCQSDLQWPVGRFSCAQFDFNFLASPNLWTNSEGRQMFGGLQKSGVYTAVYTDTMEAGVAGDDRGARASAATSARPQSTRTGSTSP